MLLRLKIGFISKFLEDRFTVVSE